MWEICNLRLIEFIAPLSEREGKDKKKNSKRQDSFFNGKKIVLGKYILRQIIIIPVNQTISQKATLNL